MTTGGQHTENNLNSAIRQRSARYTVRKIIIHREAVGQLVGHSSQLYGHQEEVLRRQRLRNTYGYSIKNLSTTGI